MSRHLRIELINLLLRVPATHSVTGRTTLLAGIEDPYFQRNEHNRRVDLELLVEQSFLRYTPDGRWYLSVLIENAVHQANGTSIAHDLQRLKQQLLVSGVSLSRLLDPHLFDLHHLVERCLDSLPSTPRLAGFGIFCESRRFLKYFCKRLKREWAWRKGEVHVKHLTINLRHGSVEKALDTMRSLKPKLAIKHVLVTMQIADEQNALRLWQELTGLFDDGLTHHLIVILAVRASTALPSSVTALGTAKFKKYHVLQWVSKIVKHLEWPPDLIRDWAKHVMAMCGPHEQLDLELVYDYLEYEVPELLQDYPTAQAFRRALAER